jgi:hypothetical protein
MEQPPKHGGKARGRGAQRCGSSDAKTRPGARKNFDKKSCFHPGKMWFEALCDFENELHEHVEEAKKDRLRFQDGRLFRCLIRHIRAKATGKDEWVAMFACYQFVTDTSRHLGYDEARRLHGEEMAARGLSSRPRHNNLVAISRFLLKQAPTRTPSSPTKSLMRQSTPMVMTYLAMAD